MTQDYPIEVSEYYIKQADKYFTIDNLNKFWKKKIR